MINQTRLDQKKCQPCEGIGRPYNAGEAAQHITKVAGWQLDKSGKGIFREYVTKNFVAAVDFICKITDVAESENHHPDIHLTGYRRLRIDLTTHAMGGLSENDFIVAAKIDKLGAATE